MASRVAALARYATPHRTTSADASADYNAHRLEQAVAGQRAAPPLPFSPLSPSPLFSRLPSIADTSSPPPPPPPPLRATGPVLVSETTVGSADLESVPASMSFELRALVVAASPIIAESALAAVYGIVDTAFVGHWLGTPWMAAGALSSAYVSALNVVFVGAGEAVDAAAQEAVSDTAARPSLRQVDGEAEAARSDATSQRRTLRPPPLGLLAQRAVLVSLVLSALVMAALACATPLLRGILTGAANTLTDVASNDLADLAGIFCDALLLGIPAMAAASALTAVLRAHTALIDASSGSNIADSATGEGRGASLATTADAVADAIAAAERTPTSAGAVRARAIRTVASSVALDDAASSSSVLRRGSSSTSMTSRRAMKPTSLGGGSTIISGGDDDDSNGGGSEAQGLLGRESAPSALIGIETGALHAGVPSADDEPVPVLVSVGHQLQPAPGGAGGDALKDAASLSSSAASPLLARITWHVIAIAALANAVNVGANGALIEVEGFLGAPLATSASRALHLGMLVAYIAMWRPFERAGTWNGWQLQMAARADDLTALVRQALAAAIFAAAESWPFDLTYFIAARLALLQQDGGGVVAIAAHAVLLQWTGFLFVGAPLGLAVATESRLRDRLSTGDAIGARRTAAVALGTSTAFMCSAAALTLVLAHRLAFVFSNDGAVAASVAAAAPFAAIFQALDGLQGGLAGVLRGAGRHNFASRAAAVSWWCLGLPLMIATGFQGGGSAGTLRTIWIAMVCANGALTIALGLASSQIDWDTAAATALGIAVAEDRAAAEARESGESSSSAGRGAHAASSLSPVPWRGRRGMGGWRAGGVLTRETVAPQTPGPLPIPVAVERVHAAGTPIQGLASDTQVDDARRRRPATGVGGVASAVLIV